MVAIIGTTIKFIYLAITIDSY